MWVHIQGPASDNTHKAFVMGPDFIVCKVAVVGAPDSLEAREHGHELRIGDAELGPVALRLGLTAQPRPRLATRVSASDAA